jgi:predicted RNA-binding protein with PUA-like domain
MNYWLVKQEPDSYSWTDFVREGRAAWTGVRNYQARNNLRAMGTGDLVFFYHSGDEKQIVGLARVAKPAYPDPTAEEGDWVAVDLTPIKPLTKPVSLAAIKCDPLLKNLPLVKNSRLSVSPVPQPQFDRLLALSQTTAPASR